MTKSPASRFLTSWTNLLSATVLVTTISCANGEMPSTTGGGTGGGTGNRSGGSGGSTGSSSGGSSFSSGGSSFSSGGSSFNSGGSSFGSGGSSFGSGGSSSTGTGGTIITGGSGGATGTSGGLVVADGFGMSGTWMGYGYTFTGPPTGSKATVSPMTFMVGSTQFCAGGMISPDPTTSSVAGLGWNINQAKATTATSPPKNTTAASGAGLLINVGNITGLTLVTGTNSSLRVQIKSATTDFCAPLAASGISVIPWTSFASMCWGSAGVAFSPSTPILAVELVIPSAQTAIGPFNVCLLDAHPN